MTTTIFWTHRVFFGRLRTFVAYVFLTTLAVVFIAPFVWMVSSSLKPMAEVFRIPVTVLPTTFRFANYTEAFSLQPFGRYFLNSAQISAFSIIGSVFSCSLAAFGFARLRFFGKNVIFLALLGSMMLPFQVTIIPLFITFRNLGWLNTHLPLIVPSYFAGAFFVFLMRQYFLTLPVELEEAAIVEGSGYFRIYARIFLPLSKPALVTVGLFTFQQSWNDFFNALIYLNSKRLFTVPLGLNAFRDEMGGYWHYMMAVAVMASIPLIIAFFIFQRYFVEGIALTGLKG